MTIWVAWVVPRQDGETGRQRRSRIARTLDILQRVCLGPRHRRLTNSAARTTVVLLIRRTVRLAAALLNNRFDHPGGNWNRDVLRRDDTV